MFKLQTVVHTHDKTALHFYTDSSRVKLQFVYQPLLTSLLLISFRTLTFHFLGQPSY